MLSRRIFAAVALLCALVLPAHAQKTKAQISTEIVTLFPDNVVGAITPTALRTVTNDIAISIMPTAPVVSGNLACFNGTTGLLQDCGLAPPASPIVGISDIQTLTNKTLTSPTISNPSITGATITGGTIASPTISSPTITTLFTATGLVKYLDLATAALATTTEYYSAAANKVVPASVIYPVEVDLGNSGAGTQTLDFSTFINARTTMTGNITTQTLSNVMPGKAGTITFIQDGTGSRTTVWNTVFKFSAGTIPALSTAANAVDVLSYSCRSATFCVASLIKDVRNP
jgi:hypothetical protein